MTADLWVITDPKGERIFGTVRATNEVEAAGRTDLGQATWFWRAEPGAHDQLGVHAAATLTERWFELGTGEPLPAGQPGGDGQVSEAWSRRFGRVREDGTWAVLTRYVYVVDEGQRNGAEGDGGRFLEIQDEFMIASDVHDLGGTEIWCDYQHLRAFGHDGTEQEAKRAVAGAAEIGWDGERF